MYIKGRIETSENELGLSHPVALIVTVISMTTATVVVTAVGVVRYHSHRHALALALP